LRAAGIFVIFSAGNDGPESGTVGSPASLPGAFAVGAIDQDDEVASFSSRGPSPWGEIRPHVAAPGVNVYSTLPGGTYGDKQGTSMAAPHVAGTVALMLSARPDLSITQTAFILTSTAAPLGDVVPNNDTGFGRVDAYATVALAAKAGLISGTVSSGGQSLPGATIQATPAVSGLHGLATSDQEGHYLLFLGAGYYDLTASAFGYAPAKAHAIPVVTGTVTTYDFDLTPLPKGHVQGTATADDGKPVDAVISVLGTPITTAATSGDYHLALPGGEHTLKARALGYRVMTASVIVTAGQISYHNFVLSDSMRVLLVNSGPWYYESEVSYYREALDGLSYAYDERSIKHLPDDTPNFTELLPYDLVIWSSPSDSPRLVGAGEVLTDYLHSGGNLLLSGQDVGFWDGGGSLYFHPYYFDFLHSAFRSDNAPSRQVVCLNEGALGAITLTIQGAGGANNQRWPDEISVLQPDQACNYNEGQGAVIQAGFCSAYRALNLGFGFEAINDAGDRSDFMARALDWFASPRQQVGVQLLRQTDPVQIAPPGHTVTHTFQLRNLGEAGAGDAIQLQVSGDEWPATLLTPTVDLSPCAKTTIDLRVEIPPDVTWDAFDALTLTARSSVSATVSQSVVLTSKVPAPVLLVDDDRWYDQEQKYEDALNAARLPYDRWEVKGIFGTGSPPAEVMGWYPVVLWFNGYDWFDPIHPSELPRLTDYLEGGGRLFLSSQEYLYTIGPVTLTRDYFGVIDYSEVLSQTRVRGVPGHVLGDGLGPVNLSYPFKNWSDSVLPAPGTQVAFRGQHGQPAAVTREGTCAASPETCRWRSAFFAFPFETFPEETRTILISRLVGWLSWLGRSSFQADPVIARVNETTSYTLTLHNDGPEVVSAVTVSNTLPSSTTLVAGPDGGASYDSPNRRITWSGDLAPGEVVTITYQLSLTGHTAHDTLRNTSDIVLGEQGLHFQRQASVRIAAPDLSGSEIAMSPWNVPQSHGDATQSHGDATQSHGDATQSHGDATQTPPTAGASTEVLATLILRNDGLDDAPNVTVDNPLPWPLRLVTGTLSSGGVGLATEITRENRVLWEGALAVGAPVTLTYRAVAPPVLKEATWLYNALRLDDGLGGAWEQGGWLYVKPHRFYFPITTKSR